MRIKMKQIELTKLEENNASYSTDPEINRTSLHLAVAAKASRSGNHEAAARAFLSAVGSTKYPDTKELTLRAETLANRDS